MTKIWDWLAKRERSITWALLYFALGCLGQSQNHHISHSHQLFGLDEWAWGSAICIATAMVILMNGK